MNLGEFRKLSKDAPDELEFFRINIYHTACTITLEDGFLEKCNDSYFEYFSEEDMCCPASKKIRAIIVR